MKRIITICAAILMTASVWAQSPEKMSYQAVVRDGSNNLVSSTAVGMQISILQGSTSGTAVYVETQTPTSNANGLVSIEIGDGTVVSGTFTTIDWANGPYFIKTETDPTGGTSYTISGISQLLSVPYALHAKTAENVTGTITETDPIFGASVASGITGADTTNWNNKLDSYTETDPLWSASPSYGITNTNITNWNSAYGWGNHATAGYLTSFTETDPSVPTGTQAGQMQYWNGNAWVTVAGTENEGATLQMIGGVPTWIGGTPPASDVTNPTTGEIWLDRNLGASQVATSSTDAASYGHLYQWGRAADGHESRTSGTTSTLATSNTPGHGAFITTNSMPNDDWRNPKNDDLWQGVSGINNPCPTGYRLPTEAEWQAERTSWGSGNAAGAFASPLKLPVAGYRNNSTGSLSSVGSDSYYWSSTVDVDYAVSLYVGSNSALTTSASRVYGFSVRCIKD